MTDVTTKNITQTADGIVTREVRGEETDLIRVPVSSTRDDRDGDNFSEDALRGMQEQIQREQPLVFLNHGFTSFEKPLYDARETIGTQVDAKIEDAKDGDGDKDLVALVLPDPTHPEGERLAEQVEQGQAVKFSVGFRVLEAEPKDPEAENDERRTFNAVDLMETSKVGIPANPDASATVAAKAATLAESLGAADVEIEDPAEFASVLAGELVRKRGPVTRETVEDATPVKIDGQTQVVTRAEPIVTDPEIREAMNLPTMAQKETKEECEVDTDCGEGEVCIEGECVPEDEVDDSFTPVQQYALRQTLREELSAALPNDGAETAPDDTDGEATPPEETFTVEVDGETKTYSPDDIEALEAAASEASVAESQTVTDPGAHEGVEAPGETTDADGTGSEADDGPTKSVQEELYGR